MSWHWLVFGLGDQLLWVGVPVFEHPPPGAFGDVAVHGCFGVVGPFCRPLTAPVSSFLKRRGSFTTAAAFGLASGTLMTSIRHWDGFGLVAAPLSQPASSVAARTPAVP